MKQVYLGETLVSEHSGEVNGAYVTIAGESFYKISNVDCMDPFFMSIVSSSDHWMFIGSNGGLSAGRVDSENALFPYYTHDKLIQSAGETGSYSAFLVQKNGLSRLWIPFSPATKGIYSSRVNLYKSFSGSEVMFEEVNEQLGLSFRVSWSFSQTFGFVRKSTLTNLRDEVVSIELLDGIRNILPYGIGNLLQNVRSNLANAYKKSELDEKSGLGIYSLSAMIVDKAEPSEALQATTVWQCGLDSPVILLSDRQVPAFTSGKKLSQEADVRAFPGCYLLGHTLRLSPLEQKSWMIVAEINQNIADIASIQDLLEHSSADAIQDRVDSDVLAGKKELERLVGLSDGFQVSSDQLTSSRFFSNVLFNIMRGGIFDEGYDIEVKDFLAYLEGRNHQLLKEASELFSGLSTGIELGHLLEIARNSGSRDLLRIAQEYLPLTFSRRHGDPSRPWNKFSIQLRDAHGNKNRNYQGNWRDIFQNWEALLISFPEYTESVIAKFLNASTIDGYNPYRITRSGIDWEVIEPDDPWSFIGYWGDHQIIYLLKLLEFSEKVHPGLLSQKLADKSYVFANVPYRIKTLAEMLENPRDTVRFDEELEQEVTDLVKAIGADGKLVRGKGEIQYVSLIEKLLVPFLAKMSNFIPDGGIWLNTQRPEWNDANNALVGYGVSMVTLYYMKRYLQFCRKLVAGTDEFQLSEELASLLLDLTEVLFANADHSGHGSMEPSVRRIVVRELGLAGERYRSAAYSGFSGQEKVLSGAEMERFFQLSEKYLDDTIFNNKRSDGLFHSYNLVSFREDGFYVEHLYEMLEGQVAVLSSGSLKPEEVITLMEALKSSAMYRKDQNSYMLYPDRDLPQFLDRNNIPEAAVARSKLLSALADESTQPLVVRDLHGALHFNGNIHNIDDVRQRLDELRDGAFGTLVSEEEHLIEEIFESMFNHHAFTGRSGTFFGYEGLGSIYWHMVSKLVLALGEVYHQAVQLGADSDLLTQLAEVYYATQAGIGLNKSPELYGAVPTDPYSHTPAHAGAQQPGMTGQVKEDVLSRYLELGVLISDGAIQFEPSLLRSSEFTTEETIFRYISLDGMEASESLPPGHLAFTLCQVPVIYRLGQTDCIEVWRTEGEDQTLPGKELPKALSSSLMRREGQIEKLIIEVSRGDQ